MKALKMIQYKKRKMTKKKIYHELRRAILINVYKADERLIVGEISSKFGTSVSPVRDALQMLGQEGLITIKPNSGYYVTSMTLKELSDLLDLREILETVAIKRAAQKITDSKLQQLENVHNGYTGDSASSYERYTDENRKFHVLIAEASGNQALADMIGRLHDRLARFMVLRRGGKIQTDTHKHLVETLRKGDKDTARKILLMEIRQTQQRILESVMSDESERWTLKK